MKSKFLLSLLLVLCITLVARAAPARKGIVKLYQPDGSSFEAICYGDESGSFLTTPDGLLLDRAGKGEYRYAYFDESVSLRTFDVPVGKPVPAYVRLKSSVIPYAALSSRASSRDGMTVAAVASRPGVTRSIPHQMRSIVLLAQFQDLEFTFPQSDFVDMISSEGYSRGGAEGSVVDYLSSQFGSGTSFEFDVAPVVTLSHSFSYYGSDSESRTDVNAPDAVIEACHLSDDVVDFSLYDNDGDGVVENLIVIVAGWRQNEGAGQDFIWPHAWSIVSGTGRTVSLDGVRIDNYAMSTELSYDSDTEMPGFTSIGVFCHEFGHLLGLKDMYDIDDELNGQGRGLWGTTSVMDYGCNNNDGRTPPNFNSIEMEILGLGKEIQIRTGEISLGPLDESREYIRMDADVEGEFFLMENRVARGWDRFIGGEGLLVYHVDRSSNNAGGLSASDRWEKNCVNANSYFECAHLIPALSGDERRAEYVSEVFFGTGCSHSLYWRTHPDYSFRSGKEPLFSLSDIVRNGKNVILTVTGPVSIDSKDVFQDAVILNWSTDVDSYMDHPTSLSWEDADGVKEVTVEPYSPGHYAFTVEGLSPKTSYKFTISYAAGVTDYKSVEFSVTTKALYTGSLPFIYLNDAARTVDLCFQKGTRIPLRIYNLPVGCSVEWFFDRLGVQVDRTGYYTLDRDGILEARIKYPDETTEIILKQISVK